MLAAATTAATTAATAATTAATAYYEAVIAAPMTAASGLAHVATMPVAFAAGARTWPWTGEYAGRKGQIRQQIRNLCMMDVPIENLEPFLYSYVASTAPKPPCLPLACSDDVLQKYETIVSKMPYKRRLSDKVRRKTKCKRLNRKRNITRTKIRRKMRRIGGRVHRTRKRQYKKSLRK